MMTDWCNCQRVPSAERECPYIAKREDHFAEIIVKYHARETIMILHTEMPCQSA